MLSSATTQFRGTVRPSVALPCAGNASMMKSGGVAAAWVVSMPQVRTERMIAVASGRRGQRPPQQPRKVSPPPRRSSAGTKKAKWIPGSNRAKSTKPSISNRDRSVRAREAMAQNTNSFFAMKAASESQSSPSPAPARGRSAPARGRSASANPSRGRSGSTRPVQTRRASVSPTPRRSSAGAKKAKWIPGSNRAKSTKPSISNRDRSVRAREAMAQNTNSFFALKAASEGQSSPSPAPARGRSAKALSPAPASRGRRSLSPTNQRSSQGGNSPSAGFFGSSGSSSPAPSSRAPSASRRSMNRSKSPAKRVPGSNAKRAKSASTISNRDRSTKVRQSGKNNGFFSLRK